MSDIRKRVGKKGTTYQVRYPDKSNGSGYSYATFRTLKEARAFTENLGSLKVPLSRTIRTVAQAADRWLDTCSKEGRGGRDPVSAATLRGYEYRAELMKAYPWDKELHALEPPDVAAFRSWLLRNYTRDQARKTLSSFHSVILEMNHQGIMAHDPALTVSVRKESRYDAPVTIPTITEMRAVLRAADDLANDRNHDIARAWQRYRPMLYLAADSGMRPQEYLVLPGRGLLETGIKVEQALDRTDRIGPTKTKAGRRFIPVGSHTLEMVRRFIAGRKGSNELGLVFPTRSGSFQRYRNWHRKGWVPAMEKAGLMVEVEEDGESRIKSKYPPYALRHFFASMLIEQNKNLKFIQSVMGHQDIKLTLDVYGHLIKEKEAAAMTEAQGVLSYVL